MFGWRKKNSDPMEAELREATLKRLAEVLDLPEEAFKSSNASRQIPSRTVLEIAELHAA